MEISLIIAIFTLGVTVGSLITAALYSDHIPPQRDEPSKHGGAPL